MKKLKEIPFNHELIGQQGIVVKFRDGEDVEIFTSKKAIMSNNQYPIVAFDNEGESTSHNINGKFNNDDDVKSQYDLIMYQEIEVKEPRVIWVNFYENTIFGVYSTKKGADDFSVKGESYETVKFIEVIEKGERTLYTFMYNDFVYESAYSTISIHTTKTGAYKAMKKHKLQTYQEWYEYRMINGKKWDKNFAWGKDWMISTIKIND